MVGVVDQTVGVVVGRVDKVVKVVVVEVGQELGEAVVGIECTAPLTAVSTSDKFRLYSGVMKSKFRAFS